MLSLLLQGCDKANLPEYWLCEGNSEQLVKNSAGTVTEAYSGSGKLLLELYKGTVTQYVSKAFTGVYQECVNTEQALSFRLGGCSEFKVSDAHFSEGLLNKGSGELIMSGARSHSQGKIQDRGVFQCKLLGHHIPATIFE